MEDAYLRAGINILGNVLEKATENAVYYMIQCDRNTLTSDDMKYGMRYAVRTMGEMSVDTPQIVRDMMIEEEEEDEESDEEYEDDEDDFSRYQGDDEKCIAMNEYYDSWDAWEPETPAERLLKKSIDKIGDVQGSEEDFLLDDSE
jgi:histone H3/H4